MKKETRIAAAHDNVDFSKKGSYTLEGEEVKLDLCNKTMVHKEAESLNENIKKNENKTQYKVVNVPTVKAIMDVGSNNGKIGVMNFASAKNPGGGAMKGSVAQEESLVCSSSLYFLQTTYGKEYYEINRKCKSLLYTNTYIYSQDVEFFRDEKLNLLKKPVKADVITVPAVNRRFAKDATDKQVYDVMYERMKNTIIAFINNKVSIVILGAFGAGVFGNDPYMVSDIFRKILVEEDLEKYFDKIIFAILERNNMSNNLQAFKNFADIQ